MRTGRVFRGRLAGAGLLLALCGATGCRHKAPPPVPQATTAPPLTPSSITVITPLPSVPPQATADVKLPAPAPVPAPAPAPVLVKHRRRLHRRQVPPSTASSQTPTEAPTPAPALPTRTAASIDQSAAASEAPVSKSAASTEAAPALGQLSTGTAINPRERTRMLSAIQVQEVRLDKVKGAATEGDQTLGLQIRSFLEKAREAIAENDLDGAETLTTKARVLLDEMQSE